MAVQTYTVGSNDILHSIAIDFVKRPFTSPVHVVQFDNTLPIIEVELFENNEHYVIPNDVDIWVRWSNGQVYKQVLGCSSDRKKVYFSIDQNMVEKYGDAYAIIEVVKDDGQGTTKKVAGSSPLLFQVDKNPIQIRDLSTYAASASQPSYNYIIVTEEELNDIIDNRIRQILNQNGN